MSDQPVILAVDQNRHNLELLSKFLSKQGYRLFMADSRAAFDFSLGQLAEISLALVDISSLSLKLWKKLREQEIPILVISDRTHLDNWQFILAAGDVDYVIKPLDKLNLLTRLRSLLRLKLELTRSSIYNQELTQMTERLSESNQHLRSLAFKDGLTGIANRRYFEELFERHWKIALQKSKPLSLVMIDVDFFKLFNDNYGHQEGDKCLKLLAKALTDAVQRPGDVIARYGGEEFVALLSNINEEGAIVVAEGLRDSVAAMAIPHLNSKVSQKITISLGVSTIVPDKNSSPQDLIKRADEALYLAKKEGRDRIKAYSQLCCKIDSFKSCYKLDPP